jgi:hypothetical protein
LTNVAAAAVVVVVVIMTTTRGAEGTVDYEKVYFM